MTKPVVAADSALDRRFMTLALALFSKLAAVLLTIPGPVLGAYLMLAMGMLFVSG